MEDIGVTHVGETIALDVVIVFVPRAPPGTKETSPAEIAAIVIVVAEDWDSARGQLRARSGLRWRRAG